MSLAEFLLARIAEDEDRAAVVTVSRSDVQAARLRKVLDARLGRTSPPWVERLAAADEAPFRRGPKSSNDIRRQIIAEYERAERSKVAGSTPNRFITGVAAGLEFALCVLALAYADHPDYRNEWRP